MTEPGAEQPAAGSLRALLASLLGLLQTHVELVGVELQEEKERLRGLALLAALAGAGVGLALLAFSALLVALFWEQRVVVLAVLALGWLALGVGALIALRNRLATHANPFAATLAEIAKDRERLS